MKVKVFGKTLLEIQNEDRIKPLPNAEIRSTSFAENLINSTGGITVTQNTALNLVPVWACVRLLSQSIASLPVSVYRKDANGNRSVASDHPVQKLLKSFPSPFYNSFTFRETLMAHLLLWGNAYAVIRKKSGRPYSLELKHPSDVEVKKYTDSLVYKVNGEPKLLSSAEIIHIVGLSFNGVLGQSPIKAASDAIYVGLAAQTYGKKFFENGAHVGGVLISPGLSDEQFTRLSDQWNSRYSGVQNAGKTPILEGGTDYKPIGMPPEDAQFMQTREFSRSEIAGFFGVPPHLIGDLSRATFSNIEHQAIDFVQHSILPWVNRIETELNRKLLFEVEQEDLYIKFNLNGLMRGDSVSRADYYTKMHAIGTMNANEIRQLEDMNTIENGDKYYVPLNFVTTDQQNQPTPDTNGNENI